ncbi:membrane bound O-acyl transferase family-domain-containing protein [Colletotrichum navitas]|uniref:Membrane bound O-acyl transferase family-domain-containing protein n=1 Tax=Colletotrichum navitas TaxID=681940 RepID=A0AAD8Q3R1_9PEZI|nr:membrane bound O-acyl transferase family-domain-containing protein [Colletotrichum navitas]KAK1595396.1 membrane bound O-acyl transferase family-domain-containing protein [Colletotrichum navitas]
MNPTATSTVYGGQWLAGLLVAHYVVLSISILGLSATSRTRYASVFLLGVITFNIQKTFVELSQSPYSSATVVPFLSQQLMSSSELIIISRAVGTDFYSGNSSFSLAIRVLRISLTVWNLRRIGTKWLIRIIPPYSMPRSRIAYAVRTLGQTAFAYFLMDLIIYLQPDNPVFYSVPKQTLGLDILELSWQDLGVRLTSTVFFYATIYCVLVLQYNLVSLPVVLTGLSSPSSWPPLFGSPLDAYSLRRFWGLYWHQTLRKWLTGHADAISDKLLGIPRGTKMSVYTRLSLTFLLSGIFHVTSDLGMGIPSSEAGSFTTFLLQPVGIMMEDLFLGTLGKVILLPKVVKRLLGFLWVLAFLSYSTPTWFYAQQRLAGNSGDLLPFRVAPKMISYATGNFSS